MVENMGGKGRLMITSIFFPFYTPVEDGTYYGITHGWRAGRRLASTSLSGAYLQNYSSYGYEISWVDRSHQGGVLLFFILEFCPVNISKIILARVMKFHGCIDLIKGECSAQEP